ncbi:MAG: hypothetical protein P8P56_06575 [Yoonia sp.]|nr:hypothetical protein [Yoonia sp.]MDG1861999.1 hypothetical protein [Yoonia sp.]
MAIKVEHEIHQRRKGRNFGVLALLIGFVGLVFALTVVKVLELGDAKKFENFDHVARPAIVPEEGASE